MAENPTRFIRCDVCDERRPHFPLHGALEIDAAGDWGVSLAHPAVCRLPEPFAGRNRICYKGNRPGVADQFADPMRVSSNGP
jgi:hypothetical protein